MNLAQHLRSLPDGTEVTVLDNAWDIEVYFYNNTGILDSWDRSMLRLAELLTVTKVVDDTTVNVNLIELIEKHMDQLKAADLFIVYDIDNIVADIESILAGFVSESWLEKFVKVLED